MSAKDLHVAPIAARDARRVIRQLHYSGKVDTRSQVHLGVFHQGLLKGAVQLGPSLDKRKSIGLVAGTLWNEYLDLHRVALADDLPIKKNTSMWRLPDGTVHASIIFEPGFGSSTSGGAKGRYGKSGSETSGAFLRRIGAKPIPGYQFRYIYFLDPSARERLTVPEIPFSDIPQECRMYRGQRASQAGDDPHPEGTAAVQR